ncbi:hypothetical protein [Entomohabitans teleogrylli]|uniref:hypothetical protein n=1 Tax=Entomohabitans teleogrylli TaxID=1384589 RepID=UPI00073D9B6A|nr:hypothetical protein [Entomohabitans teleogrylli]
MTYLPIIALLGVLLIVVVYLVMRKRSPVMRLLSVAIALAAVIAAGLFWHHQRGAPEQTGQTTQFDEAMARVPLYQAIQEKDPALWHHLREQALAMQRQGKSEQEQLDTLQQQILRVSMLRLQQTPDADAVAYMKANMAQTALMEKQGEDICFRFLYPAVKGGVNPLRWLPPDAVAQRMKVDAQMYNASFGAQKHTVTEDEREQAHRDVQPIIRNLIQRYGDNFDLTAHPERAVGQEALVCDMVQALWEEVFKLPEDRAAAIIRYSVAVK